MARKQVNKGFSRNMFIMLITIMIGVVIITYFFADIMRRSQIETLTFEHKTEMQDIASRNENFTDHFLQGSIKMDAAREVREEGNYHFDLALLWFNSALAASNNATLDIYRMQIIDNCSEAKDRYITAHTGFDESKYYYKEAMNYTDQSKYLHLLGYYISFAQSGENITLLRYNASEYLLHIAENLTLELNQNVTDLWELFNASEDMYNQQMDGYTYYGGYIDQFLFFDRIREEH